MFILMDLMVMGMSDGVESGREFETDPCGGGGAGILDSNSSY